MIINHPGLYLDVSHDDYHQDPVAGGSISSSAARALMAPGCPAKYHYATQNGGRRPTRAMELGQAAHLKVLGAGAGLALIDFDDYKKGAARVERDEARAAGLVPLLAREMETVDAMAAALLLDPIAAEAFAPGSGTPEATIVWEDSDAGVWCRARIDWLRHVRPSTRVTIIPDYKTCVSADPEDLSKVMARLGYHQQADWYLEAVRSIDHPNARFLFICQEREPPYIVTAFEPDATALRIARDRNAYARYVWRTCRSNQHWPAYADGIELLSLPRWVEAQEGAHQL